MPLLKNAKKALRSSKRKAEINNRTRSRMRTMLTSAKTTPSQEAINAAFSAVDRSVKRNLIHANKAARLKSQLSKLIGKAVAAVTTTEKKATTKPAKAKKAATKKTAKK